MIAQKSNKSKIYHRVGCRYIERISADSLALFDTVDDKTSENKPCKCCCNVKAIYHSSKSYIDSVLKNSNVDLVEILEDHIDIKTTHYNWRIALNPTTQEINLFIENKDSNNPIKDYSRVDTIKDSKNMLSAIKHIASEEKVAEYPLKYRRYALQLDQYAKENHIEFRYDGFDLYALTELAAWKISYCVRSGLFKLMHSPLDGKVISIEDVSTLHYHAQTDTCKTSSPMNLLIYLNKHDNAKKIENISYKYLPRNTKRQRDYYRQAENRARRKSVSRVLDIFAEWDSKKNCVKAC